MNAPKYRSRIGLDFKNEHADLFCFQLIGPDGLAHALVDFNRGLSTRFLAVDELKPRHKAIIRLATIHFNRARA